MCWSLEVSVIVGTISYTIAAYLWIRNYVNDRWHATLLFTVSTIQFLEAIIWYMNQNGVDTSNTTKIIIVFLIPLVLSLEPVAALFGANMSGVKINTFDKIFYTGVSILLFLLMVSTTSYPNVFKNGSIMYQKNTSSNIYYILFYILLVYPFIKYNMNNPFYILISIVVAIALIMSINKSSPGSIWCLYGNVISLLALFYPYITST